MLFDYKDAASKYRTEVLGWGGGSELGRQELGKHHSTTAGETVLKCSPWDRCTVPSLWGCAPQLLLSQGTLPEAMDGVILSALHLALRHNAQH